MGEGFRIYEAEGELRCCGTCRFFKGEDEEGFGLCVADGERHYPTAEDFVCSERFEAAK